MDCAASEKGDFSDNLNTNTISNGKGNLDNNSNTENVKSQEAPTEIKPCSSEVTTDTEAPEPRELVDFTVVYNKTKHDITFPLDSSISDLKAHLEKQCGAAMSTQKIIIKGLTRDNMTLRSSGIVKGTKVMLIGSKMDDVLAVKVVPKEEETTSQASKEPLCMQKIHKKVLDKGIPPDVMPGIKGVKEPLPPVPLSGMLNKHGGKVRLTFKPEQDQLWLGTKERTEKLAMTTIKGVTSEPIKDHEEYHIMSLQLGPTEASRYWVYWVPAQYIEAIKDAVLGVWQFF